MDALTTALNHGVMLTRWPVTTPDELQPPAFWQAPLDQMYAQMPFKGLWDMLELSVFNKDHPEQDRRRALKKPCLEDYAPDIPGCQDAIGLTTGIIVEMGVAPTGYTPDYTGPARPITLAACQASRKALAHEIGHMVAWVCRLFYWQDDIARLCTAAFNQLRPHQAANDSAVEDFAEVYRALCGCNETRGYFSDGRTFTPSPELYSLIRCLYWLTATLKNRPVVNVSPKPGCVWYQALYDDGYHWRSISALDWHSEQWTGSAWIKI